MYNKGDVRLFRPWSVTEPASEPEDFDAEHPVDDSNERSFIDRGNTNVRSSQPDSILDEIIRIGATDRAASSLTTHVAGKRARQSSVEAEIDKSKSTKDKEPSPVKNKDSELFPRSGGLGGSCRSVRAMPPSNLSIPLIAGFVVDNDSSIFHSTYQQDCLLGVNVPQCVFHSSMIDRVLNRVASAPGQSSVTSMPHGLYTPMAMEQAVEMLHRQDAVAKQMKKQRPKKFRCEHCDVAFSNNGQLKGHVRIHTGERPFKCDFEGCGKTFTRNEELTRHKRIHTGIRPHACFVCGKRFGRKDHLKKHMRTHENRDPYRLSATTLGIFGQHPFSSYNFQI
ncbi:hypothetical protein K0M31_009117 [Melipona bicolor]|uniref:C2H2-type domain-containing protein n=1 Tax=Melipona bicolor TaxID=60889 RepID=A0AA40FPK8_9HYME|nr:hypothetical protein K0M31_009117 [Melipona bicolor]